MSNGKVCIYGLRDPRDRCVRYVGQTTDPEQRLIGHRKSAIDRKSWKRPLARWLGDLLFAGVDPELVVLEEVPLVEGNAAERGWIARLRAEGAQLFNQAGGGGEMGRGPDGLRFPGGPSRYGVKIFR